MSQPDPRYHNRSEQYKTYTPLKDIPYSDKSLPKSLVSALSRLETRKRHNHNQQLAALRIQKRKQQEEINEERQCVEKEIDSNKNIVLDLKSSLLATNAFTEKLKERVVVHDLLISTLFSLDKQLKTLYHIPLNGRKYFKQLNKCTITRKSILKQKRIHSDWIRDTRKLCTAFHLPTESCMVCHTCYEFDNNKSVNTVGKTYNFS